MSPWSSEPRLTPRGARLVAGICLLLLAFAFGPAPRPAVATALACAALVVLDGLGSLARAASANLALAHPERVFADSVVPLGFRGTGAPVGLRAVTASIAGVPSRATSAPDEMPCALRAPSRGIHEVLGWAARIDGPLGLVSARASVVGPSRLVVPPAPMPEAQARTLGIVPMDGLAGRSHPAPPQEPCPAGLRAWRPGDPLRAVHGRASARRGRPVVREDEPPTASGVAIELDRAIPLPDLEFALAALTRIVLDAEAGRVPLRIRSQGVDLSIGPGNPHAVGDALRFVAGARPTRAPLPKQSDSRSVELTHLAHLGGMA